MEENNILTQFKERLDSTNPLIKNKMIRTLEFILERDKKVESGELVHNITIVWNGENERVKGRTVRVGTETIVYVEGYKANNQLEELENYLKTDLDENGHSLGKITLGNILNKITELKTKQ